VSGRPAIRPSPLSRRRPPPALRRPGEAASKCRTSVRIGAIPRHYVTALQNETILPASDQQPKRSIKISRLHKISRLKRQYGDFAKHIPCAARLLNHHCIPRRMRELHMYTSVRLISDNRYDNCIDKRKHLRLVCRLCGRVITPAGEFPCSINDISLGGISFSVYMFPVLSISEHVSISALELGFMSGEVRWSKNSHYGLHIKERTTTKFIEYYSRVLSVTDENYYVSIDEQLTNKS